MKKGSRKQNKTSANMNANRGSSPRATPRPTAEQAKRGRAAINGSRVVSFQKCKEFKHGLRVGTYELVEMKVLKPNTKLHKMWEVLRVIRKKETGAMCDAVQCGRCKRVLTFHDINGSRSLSRHLKSSVCKKSAPRKAASDQIWTEKIDPSAEAKRQFTTAFAEYCAQGLRPPECAKDIGLINLIQKVIDLAWQEGRMDAEKLMPCPTTVKTYIESEAQIARQELAAEVRPLIEQYQCSATSDCYTDDQKKEKYVVLTLQYIKDWVLTGRMFFVLSLPHGDASTTENLHGQLGFYFGESDVDPGLMDRITWVSDAGSDLKKALENYRWMYCMTHSLNIVLRTSLAIKYSDVVESALDSSTDAREIIDEANAWIASVRKELQKRKIPLKEFKFKTSNESSQSHVGMLRSIIKNREQVEALLGDDAPTALIHVEESSIKELVGFLWPFDLDGSRETSPQMSTTRYIKTVVPHLALGENDSIMTVSLKESATKCLAPMEIILVLERCKDLVAYLKRSGTFNQLPHATKQEICTKWNSHYDMLESLEDQWPEICELLNKSKKTRLKLIGITLTDIQSLMGFLQPFSTHTDKLQGQHYPTIIYAEPAFDLLVEHCCPKASDGPGLAAVRAKAYILLLQKVIIKIEHKIAKFLWPHMKHLQFYSEEEKQNLYTAVRMRLDEIDARARPILEPRIEPEPSTSSAGSGGPGNDTTDSLHLHPHPSKRARKTVKGDRDIYGSHMMKTDTRKDEVQRYIEMDESAIGDDSDLLHWWKTQGSVRFPRLSRLAQQILAIPASGAPSERVCSDLGVLLDDRRNSVMPTTVSSTLTLRDHLRHKRRLQKSMDCNLSVPSASASTRMPDLENTLESESSASVSENELED